MKIIKINWLDIESLEAEVTVSDGLYNLICFAHPFNLTIGDNIKIPLYALGTREIQRSLLNYRSIQRVSNKYSYYITGILDNIEGRIIKIGSIRIELDVPLPFDIKLKEFVSFCCERIDILT